MNWFTFALIAQFVAGTSVVFDKLIYKKLYSNPLGYTFWLGLLGLFPLFLMLFGANIQIPLQQLPWALIAGMLFIAAMFFFFLAIFKGETSNEAILIAALSPIFTLIASRFFLGTSLDSLRLIIFLLLILGGIVMFFTQQKSIRLKTASYAMISSICFGLSYSLTKLVFTNTGFLTGFIWIKLGGVLAVLLMLAINPWRQKIFDKKQETTFKNPSLYFANRIYAGIGSIVIYYATFLGPAPLVNATDNIKYLFVMLGGWWLLKERFKGWALVGKITAFILISVGLLTLGGFEYYASNIPNPQRQINWGVTFSQKYSERIGLDWKENYKAIINELNPKKIRLVAYWDIIEPQENVFDFSGLDYQINLAKEKGIGIILVVGQRVPRWPECHIPDWAQKLSLSDRNQKLLAYLKQALERYKGISDFEYLQIENEPYLMFGECPTPDTDIIKSEISLAKETFPGKPILITDGGEFGTWYNAAKLGDVFGTTMYRRVHSDTFGYFDYNLPPEFFRIKSKIVRMLTGKSDQKFIVAELAAEPWLKKYPTDTPLDEQLGYFDLNFFKSTIVYAKLAGFDDYYLWGSEWWYWMKTKQNHPEFWDYAKEILSR